MYAVPHTRAACSPPSGIGTDDHFSDIDVNYYDNSEYDRPHAMFNKIVPNKSQKYQQRRKIDDHDYIWDDEAVEAKAKANAE